MFYFLELLSFLMMFNRYINTSLYATYTPDTYIGNTFIKTIKEKYTTHLDLVIKVEKQNDTEKTVCLFLGGASFAFTQLLLFLSKGQLNRVVL